MKDLLIKTAIVSIGIAGIYTLPYIHRATLWAMQQPFIWAGDDYHRQLMVIGGVFAVWGALTFWLDRKDQPKEPDTN